MSAKFRPQFFPKKYVKTAQQVAVAHAEIQQAVALVKSLDVTFSADLAEALKAYFPDDGGVRSVE